MNDGIQLWLPDVMPAAKQALIRQTVGKLSAIKGIVALVLGGSYARGTQRPDSDIDLGLYYAEAEPFSLEAVRQIVQQISDDKSISTVTGFYEWGAWVNGGAWIHTAAGKMDFLYRNLDQVRQTIADSQAGKWALDYLQQPPYGFHSVIYLAETQACWPLYDPQGVIAELKRTILTYPVALKQRIIQDSLWLTEFTLIHARTFAANGDVYNTVGCFTRALSQMTQVLFALNETYLMSDKKALQIIESFPIKPPDYAVRVTAILAHPGSTSAELSAAAAALTALFQGLVDLAGSYYQPRFNL